MDLTIRTATVPLRLAEHGIPPLSVPDGQPFRTDRSCQMQALILQSCDARLVLIGADLLWFSDALVDELRPDIARRCAVNVANVVLTATHTHGASQADLNFSFGARKEALCDEIAAATRRVVAGALAAEPVPVTLSQSVSHAASHLTVNRRRTSWHVSHRRIARRVQNLPNIRRPVDRRLTTLCFRGADSSPVAIVNHFTCHGVADPPGVGGADYPGHLRHALQSRLDAAIPIVFLQGFCGDVRPHLQHTPRGAKDRLLERIIGPRFRPATDGDSRRLGDALAAQCFDALGLGQQLTVGPLSAQTDVLSMAGVSGTPLDRRLRVTAWRLADQCRLVFASGEMLSGLAPDDGALSVGYSNGMVGYVAPPDEYAGGGYEIDGFRAAMALDERIDPAIGPDYLRLRADLLAAMAPAS